MIIPVAAVVLVLLFGTMSFLSQRQRTQQLNSDIRSAIDFVTEGKTVYNQNDDRLKALENVKEEPLFETQLNEALLELDKFDRLNYLSIAALHLERVGYLKESTREVLSAEIYEELVEYCEPGFYYEEYILNDNDDVLVPLSRLYDLEYYDCVEELMQKLLDEGLIDEYVHYDKLKDIEYYSKNR